MQRTPGPKIKVRILAVDDEKDITDLLVRHFTFLDYDITGVNDPVKALKMVEEEDYNIVISDIVMPGMDGLKLLRRIKSHNGGVHVIMITGYVTMHHILTAMRFGAETVFFKPLRDLSNLENAVQQCVNKILKWQDILKELCSLGKTDR